MAEPHPKVTVLMPVYNGEKYLQEAARSVLEQSFSDFEFLIINDGSTDRSAEIVGQLSDRRVSFIQNKKNLGLEKTLNKGIRLAQGDYIARMDCDDICLPDRLEKQLAFMETHPNVAVCGSQAEVFGTAHRVTDYPRTHEAIRCHMLFGSPMVHPSTMLRKQVLVDNHLLYDDSGAYRHAEDYDLWARLLEKHRFHNLDDVLIRYRLHGTNVVHTARTPQVENTRKVYAGLLLKLDIDCSADDLTLHTKIARGPADKTASFLVQSKNWLERISAANGRHKIYDEDALNQRLGRVWWKLCSGTAPLGLVVYRTFTSSYLNRYAAITKLKKAKFLIRCAWPLKTIN